MAASIDVERSCYATSGERMQHARAAKVAWIQAVGMWKVVLSAGVAQA